MIGHNKIKNYSNICLIQIKTVAFGTKALPLSGSIFEIRYMSLRDFKKY